MFHFDHVPSARAFDEFYCFTGATTVRISFYSYIANPVTNKTFLQAR